MPRIFDNIDLGLLPTLLDTLRISRRADFCVGFFNLRGWRLIDEPVHGWKGGPDACCRVLVGMQRLPHEELRHALRLAKRDDEIDQKTAIQQKREMARQFREQLTLGAPTNEDEIGLRRLSEQLKAGRVVVKLFLRFPLHAKLYLLHRDDPNNPTLGIVGSSNLTMAGLSRQGELNVDVLDHDACTKLQEWFEDRWGDRWCLDISKELAEIIDTSWAREDLIPPYHIYLKIAYHLSQEARAGLAEFGIPREFRNILFDFQAAAVRIAAHHVERRNGVLIGDVVGLGKTLVGAALLKIVEEDRSGRVLIICPKNLVRMWKDYVYRFFLRAEVLSISMVRRELPKLKRFHYVLIDESHNLRNREGKTYRAILEYIRENDSKVILLSATPYNKDYRDLSNQLRLFLPEDRDIGIRPEQQLKQDGEIAFSQKHQCGIRTLAAFEKSEHPDDWRELMRLFLIRRTRSFIMDNYAETDPANGRKYLLFPDGRRSYFPIRAPRTIQFRLDESKVNDQYARLYSQKVVDVINHLDLPRYGLGNYLVSEPESPPSPKDQEIIKDLSRAGKRLMGFCRTNLFKRLESSGHSFLLSVERHILRNLVFLHAIQNKLDLPIGSQDPAALDTRLKDEDGTFFEEEAEDENGESSVSELDHSNTLEGYNLENLKSRAKASYETYRDQYGRQFKWLSSALFLDTLAEHLQSDTDALLRLLLECGSWDSSNDAKLEALHRLVMEKHPNEKVLVFSQFADTVDYLKEQLRSRGVDSLEAVTGNSENPTDMVRRFSPVANECRDQIPPDREIRVLLSTDILSEGQNLQDSYVVVNFDLPWAIIRLVQRVGRVDRIGQQAETIHCYSFLPADGVERIIHLRSRVRQRLQENAEVVGSDEMFFEDDRDEQAIVDLYNEKAGILDGEPDDEVDLSSQAFQIWQNATKENPALRKAIEELPDVVFSAKPHLPEPGKPPGVLVYVRTAEGNDALAWVDEKGRSVSESQFAILKAAECTPETPAFPHHEKHHEMVHSGVEHIAREEKTVGGQLGSTRGARYRVYERLMKYLNDLKDSLFETEDLRRVIDDIYKYPLRETAKDAINRQLRAGIGDEALAELVITLRDEDRLCITEETKETQDPRIICSMGLIA